MTQLVDREPTSPAQAIQLQERLRPKVNLTKTWECLSVIGAVDCSHAPGATMGAAGIILYRYPELVELSRTVITIGALLRWTAHPQAAARGRPARARPYSGPSLVFQSLLHA